MEKEKGSDELLYEIVTQQEVLEPVLEDNARRAKEEERVSAQPKDGNLG